MTPVKRKYIFINDYIGLGKTDRCVLKHARKPTHMTAIRSQNINFRCKRNGTLLFNT